MFSAGEIFDIAVQLEKNGERLYREALEYVSDKSLRDTLLWLADEEVRHKKRFIEMKESVEPGSNDLWAEQMSAAVILGAVRHRAFSLEDVDFKSVRSESELMKIAMEFEEDGVTFYEILCSFITDADTLEAIEKIIEEERKHIECLQKRQAATVQASKGS